MEFLVAGIPFVTGGAVLQTWWWEAHKRWIGELVRWGLVDPAVHPKNFSEGPWSQRPGGFLRATAVLPGALRATVASDDELPEPCVQRRREADRRRRFYIVWMLVGWVPCLVLGALAQALV
jgi:hypothetical protein